MLYCFIWSYVFNTILFHLVIWYVFNAILLHLITWYVFNKSLNFFSTHSSSSDIIITIYHYHEHSPDITVIISYHHHNIPLLWTLTWHSIHHHLTSSLQYTIIMNTHVTSPSSSHIIITIYHYYEHLHDNIHHHLTSSLQYTIIMNTYMTQHSSSHIIITIYHYYEHLHDTAFIIWHHHNIPLFWTLTWHSIHQHPTSLSQYIIIINTYMTQHSKKFKLSLQKHVFLIICSSLKHENNLKFHKNERATSFLLLLWWRAKTKKNHLKQKGQH